MKILNYNFFENRKKNINKKFKILIKLKLTIFKNKKKVKILLKKIIISFILDPLFKSIL